MYNILSIVIEILQSTQNFSGFHKKDQVHSLNISEVIDSLPEMWLLECPKVPVLEHPFRGNVLTGIKDC